MAPMMLVANAGNAGTLIVNCSVPPKSNHRSLGLSVQTALHAYYCTAIKKKLYNFLVFLRWQKGRTWQGPTVHLELV